MRIYQLATLAFFLSLLTPKLMAQIEQQELDSLDDLRWNHRIILSLEQADHTATLNAFEGQIDEVIDRDILWFVFSEDAVQTNYRGPIAESFTGHIIDRYFQNERTQVILIGKDGGVKDVAEYLDLADLFQRIDGMPMRQAEMRQDQ